MQDPTYSYSAKGSGLFVRLSSGPLVMLRNKLRSKSFTPGYFSCRVSDCIIAICYQMQSQAVSCVAHTLQSICEAAYQGE